ncbi:MAG: DJ-1/PfpI family protein [Nanoarchaeota archaeon]|nr:DJ-1/PfpI family protein [Nanoarchaeota archaeon]MBU1135011.1 DJ-1/PfpI family protein [Nanoarchaeota archaeon]MBU2520060.1 DJ-1/PfpI family protein [Nanoarchaeota archaeon]
MKKVLVPIIEGFEEAEMTCTVDVLRRAGLDVITAGIPATIIKGMHEMTFMADRRMEELNIDKFDALVLVGGNPGYINLGKSKSVIETIKKFNSEKKLIAAICASPSVLAKAGILENKKATIYPGMEREIPRPRDGRVIVDGNIVTSQGVGTAIEFALKIVEILAGKQKSDDLKRSLVC